MDIEIVDSSLLEEYGSDYKNVIDSKNDIVNSWAEFVEFRNDIDTELKISKGDRDKIQTYYENLIIKSNEILLRANNVMIGLLAILKDSFSRLRGY